MAPNNQEQWDEYLSDVLLGYCTHHNGSHGCSLFYLTYGIQPCLLNEHTCNVLHHLLTDAEIEELQHHRQDHVQNLEHYHDEVNARVLKHLQDLANQ